MNQGLKSFCLSLFVCFVGLVLFGSMSPKDVASVRPTIASHSQQPAMVSVNIEDIRAGNYVLAKDPVTGEVAQRKVLQAFARTSDHLRVLTLRSDSGEEQTIHTTDEHPLFIDVAIECKAGDLQIGDQVIQANGQFACLTETVREEHPAGIAVYNFEVEGFHTYFVSSLGSRVPPVWVHNTCGPSEEILPAVKAAELPWANADARRAARAIEAGQTSIKVASRDDAAELVWRMFRS